MQSYPLSSEIVAESAISTQMMIALRKMEESWETAKEQMRNENNQNDVMSCEEDEEEDFIVYSPIQIRVNEEPDRGEANECQQFKAFTEDLDAILQASFFFLIQIRGRPTH